MEQPVSSRRWLRTGLALITVLLVGLSLWVGRDFFSPPAPPPDPIPPEAPAALPLPAKPSIALLPFTNMSDDPEQEYFSDGLTDTLITDLSKIASLFVIARNSTFTYKGQAVSVEQVGRELGVRYIVEGGVQKAEDRVRINIQLIEATTGGHVWAERFDSGVQDLFALQDEIVQRIVAVR